MTERQVMLIRDFQPDIIMVTPSYMLAIIDEMERQGMDPTRCSLKYGIFGAEPWTNEMRAEIEARAGLDATDIYGLSEVIGPGVAQECVETKDGLHIWEDHFYPEVIDPVTDQVLPDGELGELVFTSLTKQAMPVIRYRTRDLTRLLPGTARTMRRMEKVTGRTDDMIILRGVNLFPTQVEELILQVPALSPHFQLHLARPGRLDTMTVHVERRPDADPSAAEAAGSQLSTLIKNTIGVTAGTVVKDPLAIERSLGKMRRIIDERPRLAPQSTVAADQPRQENRPQAVLWHDDHLDADRVVRTARPRIPGRERCSVFLGGQCHQCVIDRAPGDANTAKRHVHLPGVSGAQC